jgi:hypothetical protein
MNEKADPRLISLPATNYSSAVARAVAWLGDRYLLAKPINAGPRHAPSLQRRGPATIVFAHVQPQQTAIVI